MTEGDPSNPILPPIEQFTPEFIDAERQCAQTAFSILHTFKQQEFSGDGDVVTIRIVSGRVDALREDQSLPQTSLRLRTMQSEPNDDPGCIFQSCTERECSHFIGERSCVAVVLEQGTQNNEEMCAEDDDFEWQPKVVIVASTSLEDGLYDIFICDAQTGEQLSSTETTKLMFLLSHLHQNLTIINEEELALMAQSLDKTELYETFLYHDYDEELSEDDVVVTIVPVNFEVTDNF